MVGEAHAYWDAKASFHYNQTTSSTISAEFSLDGKAWRVSGSVAVDKSTKVSLGYSNNGPKYAHQLLVPFRYRMQKLHHWCENQFFKLYDEFDWYVERPIGYHYPAGGRPFKIGADVSRKDGENAFLNSPTAYRAVIPPRSDIALTTGRTLTYSRAARLGFSFKGVNLSLNVSASTSLNADHEQKIAMGGRPGEHDIWGAYGKVGVTNCRVFYSY